jgi:hypothetical protein
MQDHAIAGLLVRGTMHRTLTEAEGLLAPRRTRRTAARVLHSTARRLTERMLAARRAAHTARRAVRDAHRLAR